MAHSIPELLELTRMEDHGPLHPLSLWDHTLWVVTRTAPTRVLRWAALLHDIAKPGTRTHDSDGRPRFFLHEDAGAVIARDVLTGLRFPSTVVDAVELLISTHMQVHAYETIWSDGAVRRLVLRLGPCLPDALALARADAAGHSFTGESRNAPKLDQLERRIHELEGQTTIPLSSPLNGDELMERYRLPPGPWIRKIKDSLLDEVLDGRLAPDDRAGAWQLADELMARH
jgi:poly(A) polymerase